MSKLADRVSGMNEVPHSWSTEGSTGSDEPEGAPNSSRRKDM